MHPARAEIDLSAVRHNVAAIAALVGPAELCAVVKANGYGHGAPGVARAAVEAGATWLGVAHVDEGIRLRDAGLEGRILLLSEPEGPEMKAAVARGLTPTVYRKSGIDAAGAAARSFGREPLAVHLKVNTGMNRAGAQPADAVALACAVVEHPSLSLEGLWTHCAVADEPDNPFTATQLARFDSVVDELADARIRPAMLHAANSAGAIAHPDSRLDLVRCGIAIYGIAPSPALADRLDLRPAMCLKAPVRFVHTVAAGEGVSYGLRRHVERDTVVATVPLGYEDGVSRRLGLAGGMVLLGGRKRPILGTVTMDQFMVGCDDDQDVAVGDEVVLIGEQGGERITADDWAGWLDTIAYEIVCSLGQRVPRIDV